MLLKKRAMNSSLSRLNSAKWLKLEQMRLAFQDRLMLKSEREAQKKKDRDALVSAFGGWVECTDIASGGTYYHNEITGVSQWERPEEMGGAKGGDGNSPEAWIKLPGGPDPSNPGQQLHYFYNTVTGQSSWDDPRISQMRAPKAEERRRCQHGKICVAKAKVAAAEKGKRKKKGKEKAAQPAIAVRECVRCRLDYCMECFVDVTSQKRSAIIGSSRL